LPPNFTSPPHLGSKKGEATRATEGKQCHITMTAVLVLEWLCHAALGCGVQCAAQQWEQRLFLGSELKASQSQSRGARRRATGSRLISVASGVHAIKHALPVESWPPTRREGCSRASPAAFCAKTINWQTHASIRVFVRIRFTEYSANSQDSFVRYKNPVKDFCWWEGSRWCRRCRRSAVVDGSLDLSARATSFFI